MKNMKTMVLVASVLFFTTAVAYAANMDDLGVTIKMIDADDMKGASTELHLPAAASDMARKQAQDREGQGLSRANETHDGNDASNGAQDAGADKKDGYEDNKFSRDEVNDSHDEMKDSHSEIHDETKEFQEEVKETHPETPEEIQSGQDGIKDDMGDN